MNEQQLQQILTIQQAIAAAATAAVINSLLNPTQQTNALTDQQQQQLAATSDQQQQDSPANPLANSNELPAGNALEGNIRIQELLLQLQQQQQQQQHQQQQITNPASFLNTNAVNLVAGLGQAAAAAAATNATTSSNNSDNLNNILNQHSQISPSRQTPPMKKLKSRHHHQAASFVNALQAPPTPTSKQNTPSLASNTSNSASPASSSAFNVGLPRKLVRGQDVWLGRGAEQTRQILKCMWCGQSFRTLAEMTQHMKITQHYTNIISQEQITSWRQPESSETITKNGKSHQAHHHQHQQQHSRSLSSSQNQDESNNDLSGQLKESDSSDSFAFTPVDDNDADRDELDQDEAAHEPNNHLDVSPKTTTTKTSVSKSNSKTPNKTNLSPNSKLLKSKKTISINQDSDSECGVAQDEVHEDQEEVDAQDHEAPVNNNNNDHNDEHSDSADDNDDAPETPTLIKTKTTIKAAAPSLDSKTTILNAKATSPDIPTVKTAKAISNNEDSDVGNREEAVALVKANNDNENDADANGKDENDIKDDELQSETSESATATPTIPPTSSAKNNSSTMPGADEQVGDPLSALETMVEKSFDPRMRPGVANGGILQRLGIDEEVCPPWQHINYANWYAAAAYGHPMAAALLAAGINLQNGIKLSKNVTPKKNDD